MSRTLAFFFLVFSSAIGKAQTIEKGWNTFNGTIGKSNVTVNIYCDSIGNLSGDYCYHKFENRIALKGKLKDKLLFLDELVEGKVNAKFKGKIEEENSTITGKWSSLTHSDIAFFLRLNSQTGGTIDHRYSIGNDNTEVESFFKKTKEAIVKEDKVWLSKNIEYPVTLRGGKKKLKIKNAKDFLAHYTLIITPSLKKSISESCVCDIFSNWQGAMIANGSLWIKDSGNELKITAINN